MKRSLIALCFAPFLLAGPVQAAAVDYLLEIDGIKGESSDDRHASAIEIDSFAWGVRNEPIVGTGGVSGGKVSYSDLSVSMAFSKASPMLMLHCASGKHLAKAVLYVRKSGDPDYEYCRVSLQDVLVTSYQTGGVPGGTNSAPASVTDRVVLRFNGVTLEHIAEDGTVTVGRSVLTTVQ